MFPQIITNTKSRRHIGALEVTLKLLALIVMYTMLYASIDYSLQTNTLQTIIAIFLPIVVSMSWLVYNKKALSISNVIDTTYQIVGLSFPFLFLSFAHL
jgi:hypothetical protein